MILTWEGEPRTKKNSARIMMHGSRRFVAPSQAFESYQEDCILQTPRDMQMALEGPHNVRCVYYMRTKRKVDLTNLLSATMDILVKAGVLADDNSRIAAAHDGSRVKLDRQRPRVEITITQMREEQIP